LTPEIFDTGSKIAFKSGVSLDVGRKWGERIFEDDIF